MTLSIFGTGSAQLTDTSAPALAITTKAPQPQPSATLFQSARVSQLKPKGQSPSPIEENPVIASKVLLCADEPILVEGLRRILENVPELDLAGSCSRVEDLREQIEALQPDILLIDVTAEVTFAVLSGLRGAVSTSRIVLWVNAISTELAMQSMSLGVRGILSKTLSVETLIRCLMRVDEGELWFEKALTDSIMTSRSYSLTRREGQLVALLSQGLKNKEIAYQMGISEGTVKVYMSRLFQKLGVRDRFELALYGLRNLAPGFRVTDANVSAANRQTAQLWQPPRSFFVERMAVGSQAWAVASLTR